MVLPRWQREQPHTRGINIWNASHTYSINIIHYIYLAGHPVPAFPPGYHWTLSMSNTSFQSFLTSMRVTSLYSAHPSPYVSSFPIPNINTWVEHALWEHLLLKLLQLRQQRSPSLAHLESDWVSYFSLCFIYKTGHIKWHNGYMEYITLNYNW